MMTDKHEFEKLKSPVSPGSVGMLTLGSNDAGYIGIAVPVSRVQTIFVI